MGFSKPSKPCLPCTCQRATLSDHLLMHSDHAPYLPLLMSSLVPGCIHRPAVHNVGEGGDTYEIVQFGLQ